MRHSKARQERHCWTYEDQIAFTRRPAELAQSLLDMEIATMKIWPLDQFALPSDGRDISAQDMETGVKPFRKIRAGAGLGASLLPGLKQRPGVTVQRSESPDSLCDLGSNQGPATTRRTGTFLSRALPSSWV
jgi:hypothetical protein